MGIGFICGAFGCQAIEVNEEHLRTVNEKRMTWATEQKRITGKYPELEEQNEFIENWLKILECIKQVYICPCCGQKVKRG